MPTARPHLLLSSALVLALATVAALFHDFIAHWAADAYSNPGFGLVWPPTRRSAPLLTSVFLWVAGVCIASIMRAAPSAAQVWLHETKAKRATAAIVQALRWEEEDDDTLSEEEGKAEEKEEKKEKRPPEAKELFEMLYDEVEERHVTDFGISPTDTAYCEALALFKQTVPTALAEATRCTRIARGMETADEKKHGDDPKRVALFKDGYRLRELLQLYEGKNGSKAASILRAFGPLAPKPIFEAARACRNEVEREQREGGVRVLYALVRPNIHLYALSATLMAFDSAVGAANWHSVATLLDGIDSGAMSMEELRSVFVQTYAKFALCVFAHLTSCYLTEKTAGRFGNAVKSEVLRGVLRQDTSFFDVYPSGVIQERLNHDANDLCSKCFHLPMELLHMALIVVSNSLAVYAIKPELLWISIAPIPFLAIVQKIFMNRSVVWSVEMRAREW